MEVIATGKITTYAGSSRYQIIVDRIELAGEGALLKLLEDRRKKLAAEEAAIAPLKAEHDAAQVALAQVQLVVNLTHLEETWSASRNAVAKLEEQLIQARQVAYEDERRFKTLAQQVRESKQRADEIAVRIKFRRDNGPVPGYERQRSGFGIGL